MYFVMLSYDADYRVNRWMRRALVVGPYTPPQFEAAVRKYSATDRPPLMSNDGAAAFCDSLAKMEAESALTTAVSSALADSSPLCVAVVLDLAQLKAIAAQPATAANASGSELPDPAPAEAQAMLRRLGLAVE